MSAPRKAVFDVSALFEETWTGIPNVVAAIAERALTDGDIDWVFTYETIPLPRDLVRRFLRLRSGAGGLPALSQLAWDRQPIPFDEARSMVAVFPNIKPVRGYFGTEAIIVHDLSPVTTPQFHNADNIFHFANRIREDVATSDHVFCVSKATMGDVHAYLEKPMEQMSVLRLGAEFDPAELSAGLLQVRQGAHVEPYVVVIGTLEPRKNGGLVFDYLAQNPGFAHQYKMVFIGRDGWLDEMGRLMERLHNVGVPAERIQFTGFVSNTEPSPPLPPLSRASACRCWKPAPWARSRSAPTVPACPRFSRSSASSSIPARCTSSSRPCGSRSCAQRRPGRANNRFPTFWNAPPLTGGTPATPAWPNG